MIVDKEQWGKQRLFSMQQWPGLTRAERDACADRVVDRFHRAVKDAGLTVQWRPGPPELRVYGEMIEGDLDQVQLEGMLENAFEEVRGT